MDQQLRCTPAYMTHAPAPTKCLSYHGEVHCACCECVKPHLVLCRGLHTQVHPLAPQASLPVTPSRLRARTYIHTRPLSSFWHSKSGTTSCPARVWRVPCLPSVSRVPFVRSEFAARSFATTAATITYAGAHAPHLHADRPAQHGTCPAHKPHLRLVMCVGTRLA